MAGLKDLPHVRGLQLTFKGRNLNLEGTLRNCSAKSRPCSQLTPHIGLVVPALYAVICVAP
jgi:hypothetical protein